MSGPTVGGVLETCLYAPDLDAAERFYAGVIGLEVFSRVPGRHVFFRCDAAMFLVFDPEATSTSTEVPPHGARGPGHVAFAVGEAQLPSWRERFAAHGIAIESEVTWPRGGTSLYVRDPAGNCVELAPRRMWGLDDRA